MTGDPICPMCEEPVRDGDDISPTSIHVYDPSSGSVGEPRKVHRSCSLREVVGGIGHLIAHDYWCTEHHDPDAGLTRRQSALLVDVYCAVVGVDRAVAR